jgi:alpha-galactosidase
MVVDASGALASFALLDTTTYASPDPLRLVGLDPDGLYRVRLLNPPRPPRMKVAPTLTSGEPVEASGRMIETMGLPLPILRAGGIAVIHLERIGQA